MEKHQLWYESVVQPKLAVLKELAASAENLEAFPLKEFFKGFLADLEMMGLDDYTVENYIEKILDGVEALKDAPLKESLGDLKQIAMMAMLSNNFDRALFLSYWTQYRPFIKKNKKLKNESIVNAYKIQIHLDLLITYISQAAVSEPVVIAPSDLQEAS